MPHAKSSPRDVFLYLLLIITLYVSAGSLTALLFQEINVLLPDPLDHGWGALDVIRRSTAALVIVFPAHLFLAVLLSRDIVRDADKAELRIRKWLLSLTLFLAALAVIGDLVTILYRFLSGELSVRFALKALSVLCVAGAVFAYELWDIREWKRGHCRRAGLAGWGAGVAVVSCVVAGFFIAGSPWYQRSVRFDERRVNDLQMIQSEVIRYWQMKGILPKTLDALLDTISGFTPPQDPETSVSYEYGATGKLQFQLCATFAFPNRSRGIVRPAVPSTRDPYAQNWDHPAGRSCFDRTIDPDLYPKEPKR